MREIKSIWELLKDVPSSHAPFKTSLLGNVPYRKDKEYGWTAIIPEDLQKEARDNGFVIIFADFKDNSYTLEYIR